MEALADIRLGEERALLIEGELHPDSVGRLLTGFGSLVRACYVGSIATDVNTKAVQLRAYSETAPHDWLKGQTDAFMQRTAEEVLAVSRELEAAARDFKVPFFDMYPDFDAAIERVVAYLSSS
ncbi:MAG: hypothetical protein GEU75_16520 [Dehalococcoidia bacterium]|nr:hypothetical protein [Dehalococcoidia bacterium]